MKKITRTLCLIASMSAAALLAACGGGGGPAPGTLSVAMTDAPACGYDAVNVTVKQVLVHQSATANDDSAGWIDIPLLPDAQRKINLLKLTNGVLQNLSLAPLAAGHYSQLRLVLDPNSGGTGLANSVVPTITGIEEPLKTPSAAQSGLKLGHQFDVASGQRVDLLLDFDACKSIVKNGSGGYILKPVVNVIPTAVNGIDGFIDPALLLPNSHVQVSAQQDGKVVRATVPNATSGEFFLGHLDPGSYDVVITADGHAAAVIGAVPVASAPGIVLVSSAASPISLQAAATLPGTISGLVTLNPVSTTDEVAYVTAKQSFAAGPTVTIKYQGIDVSSTGAYTLSNLPTVAPQLAPYSPTLPIVPIVFTTPDATLGGKYTVEASAKGYTPQPISSVVDISAADKSGVDFTLTLTPTP